MKDMQWVIRFILIQLQTNLIAYTQFICTQHLETRKEKKKEKVKKRKRGRRNEKEKKKKKLESWNHFTQVYFLASCNIR